MLKRSKIALILSIPLFLTISTSAFASKKDGYTVNKKMMEVITNHDGSEIIFKAKGMKPEIVFEEHTLITNNNKPKEKIEYEKKLGETVFFFPYKNTEKIKALYSADGVNYHEKLNRLEDHNVKFIIKDVAPNEKNLIKIRYEHNIFGISE